MGAQQIDKEKWFRVIGWHQQGCPPDRITLLERRVAELEAKVAALTTSATAPDNYAEGE